MDFIPRIHITGISSRIDKSIAKGRLIHHMDQIFQIFTFNNKLISESFINLNLLKYKSLNKPSQGKTIGTQPFVF